MKAIKLIYNDSKYDTSGSQVRADCLPFLNGYQLIVEVRMLNAKCWKRAPTRTTFRSLGNLYLNYEDSCLILLVNHKVMCTFAQSHPSWVFAGFLHLLFYVTIMLAEHFSLGAWNTMKSGL